MPNDRAILTDMLEQVVAQEEKLARLKADANARAVLKRLQKLREDLVELLATMKTK